jgi:hypothetical protein
MQAAASFRAVCTTERHPRQPDLARGSERLEICHNTLLPQHERHAMHKKESVRFRREKNSRNRQNAQLTNGLEEEDPNPAENPLHHEPK